MILIRELAIARLPGEWTLVAIVWNMNWRETKVEEARETTKT